MKCKKCGSIAGLYRVAGGAHYELDEFERETYSGQKITLDASGLCQKFRIMSAYSPAGEKNQYQ